VPFEPVQVAVDSMSFASPLWIAPTPVLRVVPGPNQFTAYDVPIIMGAVLEGQVVGPSGEPIPGGLALTATGGGARRRVLTFSDGGFYLLGLAPGEYELSFDAQQLQILGYSSDPQRVLVPANQEGDGTRLLIRLRSRSQ
jgi:hypothetical protein